MTDPSKSKKGAGTCGTVSRCFDQPRYLEWTSADLDHAIVRGGPLGEGVAVRGGELALLTTNESGFKAVALGVNAKGTTCVFMAPGAAGMGYLQCADLPWTTWRRVREFHVDYAISHVDDDVRVRFFSEREALVSLPPNEGSSMHRYNHCIVALASSAARCVSDRAEWWPLGDGRWSLEHTVLTKKAAQLIDVTGGKSWTIDKDTRAVWWRPKMDACLPNKVVLRRVDMADVNAGTLTLP